jgi:RNA polymerase sigma factor (sigma-70 family)
MAREATGRLILCPQCKEDTGSIERLGIHLLDRHARVSGEPIGKSRDQIEAYCQESAGRSLLTHAAEVALGRLIQADGPRADEAKKLLVESNLRLVVSLVRKRRARNRSREMDLIQEGNLGLIRAAELFDPSKGFRFSTYAIWWIRQCLMRYSHQAHVVAVPEGVRANINKARKLLSDGWQPEDIEKELKIGRGTLDLVLARSSARTVSMDQVAASSDGDNTIASLLAAPEEPDQVLMKEELAGILIGLSNREKLILVRRYGLDGKVPRTLDEVGQEIGVTRERVRQVERKALAILKRRHHVHGTLLAGATRAGRFGMQFTPNGKREGKHGPIALCEGSAPVAAVEADLVADVTKEAIVADLKCEKCPGMEFKNPQALGAHRRHEHPGEATPKKGRKPKRPRLTRRTTKAASNGASNVFELALAPLRTRREEILAGIPELREIDGAIAAIEKVQGGG